MCEHELIPCTKKTAFWAITVHDTATQTQYHVALLDLASGHVLWSHSSTQPLDRDELEEAARLYRRYGWQVEAIPE